jgi:hypothetical protein
MLGELLVRPREKLSNFNIYELFSVENDISRLFFCKENISPYTSSPEYDNLKVLEVLRFAGDVNLLVVRSSHPLTEQDELYIHESAEPVSRSKGNWDVEDDDEIFAFI